jgi:hypothetical protein
LGVLLGLSLALADLELFRVLDWGHGIWRAALLLALAAGAIALLVRARTGARPQATPLLLPVAAAALAVNLYAGAQAVAHTVATHQIKLDQGQNTFRAVEYLRRIANPYAQTAMLDPYSYVDLRLRLRQEPRCLARPMAPDAEAAVARYWADVDPRATPDLLPSVADTPACHALRLQRASLGYKYGPALLAAYYPFVLAFGKPGIFVAHIAFLLLATGLFVWFGRARDESWGPTAGALVLLLAPSHLRHNVLEASASDFGPTLAGVAGIMLLARGRERWAAILIGLSVASKLLPGLLYAPLLLACRRRNWAWFLSAIIVTFVPFLIWDAGGFVNDILLFNLGRPTDSTALAHFLSRPWTVGVQVAGLAAMIVALHWARKQRWSMPSILAYLWVAHAAVLLGGAIFHNNYLIWLLPLLGLSFLSVVDQEPGTLRT